MGINRRDFLKGIGGACAVAGLSAAGGSVLGGKLEASSAPKASGHGATKSAAVRWGMVINVMGFRKPEHYNACIEACHSIHNVPHFGNIKDEIKWIWTEKFQNAFPSKSHQFVGYAQNKRAVPVLCNHCENPACVRVCPTQATFQRDDGIVLMDFHRCIGCRFCMAACPYGSRSFNWRNPRLDANTLVGGRKIDPNFPTRERGVVEKCNFCAERIAKGPLPKRGEELSEEQMPACVLASREAITFGNLNEDVSAVRQKLHKNHTIQRKAELGTNPSIFYIV